MRVWRMLVVVVVLMVVVKGNNDLRALRSVQVSKV